MLWRAQGRGRGLRRRETTDGPVTAVDFEGRRRLAAGDQRAIHIIS